MKRKNKPGPGWKRLGGAVWEHANGVRLHVGGLAGRAPHRDLIDANRWPECQIANQYIRIAGGSRKRGLMLWALARVDNAAK